MSTELFVYTIDKEVILSNQKISEIKRKDSSDKLSEQVGTILVNGDVEEAYHKIRLSPDLVKVEEIISPTNSSSSIDDMYDMIIGKVNGVYSVQNQSNHYYYCEDCTRLTDDSTQLCMFCGKAFCSSCADKSHIICPGCTYKPMY